jgi:hypothetical protein
MLQTIQFDTSIDGVTSVLDSVAKAYGYADAVLAVGLNKLQQPQFERKPLHSHYPPDADELTRSRIDSRLASERSPSAQNRPATHPWKLSNTRNFLMEITPTSRKLCALMVVEGDVSAWQVSEFIGKSNLKGIFSSIGAAKSRTQGLVRARSAYAKQHRRDGFHYVMTNEYRDLFMDAFLSAGLDKLLEEAENFLKSDEQQMAQSLAGEA